MGRTQEGRLQIRGQDGWGSFALFGLVVEQECQ